MEDGSGSLGLCRPIKELEITRFLQNITVKQAGRMVDGRRLAVV